MSSVCFEGISYLGNCLILFCLKYLHFDNFILLHTEFIDLSEESNFCIVIVFVLPKTLTGTYSYTALKGKK